MYLSAVEGDDAGRLLAAMLQGMQPERGDRRGVGMAENSEDAAFLTQPVGVGSSSSDAEAKCSKSLILAMIGLRNLQVTASAALAHSAWFAAKTI